MTLKRGYTPVLRIIQRWRKTPYWRRARRPAAERGSVQCLLFRFRNKRHAYATGLLEAGVALPVIQRRLGHSSIRSTMRYLHLAQDKTSATPSPLDMLEFPRAVRA